MSRRRSTYQRAFRIRWAELLSCVGACIVAVILAAWFFALATDTRVADSMPHSAPVAGDGYAVPTAEPTPQIGAHASGLPECQREDQTTDCVWHPALHGNGDGVPFVVIDGESYPLEHGDGIPVCTTDTGDGGAAEGCYGTPDAPAPTASPAPVPAPTASASASPAPTGVATRPDADGPTLECGRDARPAIDQDRDGNWWAYCEPALAAPLDVTLQPCVNEDDTSTNCWWDATTRGNGKGQSYVVIGGDTYRQGH